MYKDKIELYIELNGLNNANKFKKWAYVTMLFNPFAHIRYKNDKICLFKFTGEFNTFYSNMIEYICENFDLNNYKILLYDITKNQIYKYGNFKT